MPAHDLALREEEEDGDRESSPIRPERFARLVTLAGILIDAARDELEARASKLERGLSAFGNVQRVGVR